MTSANGAHDFLLADDCGFAILAASRAMTAAYRPFLEKLDLTYPQFTVLMVLWKTDDLRVTDICARLRSNSGTLTPIIKRMETNGIVERQRSLDNRREVRITLTARGHNLKEQALEMKRSFVVGLGLPRRKIAEIRVTLETLTEVLEPSLCQA